MTAKRPVHPIIAVIGTTGTGKSQLAVDLALRFRGEVINADAVQMYAGLPIITNKISIAEQRDVPHHLLGCIGLNDSAWRVDTFVARTLSVIQEIRDRGRLPILVGGTHYYTQKLLFEDDLVEASEVPTDGDNILPILDAPVEEMLSRLREVDPAMAMRWHPNDARKIRRSLEIYYKTGRRASDVYVEQAERRRGKTTEEVAKGEAEYGDADADNDKTGVGLRFPTLFLWTHTPREPLKKRLRERVDNMVSDGLIEEAHTLELSARSDEAAGVTIDKSRGIYISIGYKEFLPYFLAQDQSVDEKASESLKIEAVENTKSATWRYAKYQERWIRLKLLPALTQAALEKSIFVLDTSIPHEWESRVLSPATEFVGAFLNGEELPDNQAVSAHAEETIGALRESEILMRTPLLRNTRTCDVCNVSATTDVEWAKHVNSNRHRRCIKSREKKLKHNVSVSSEVQ